MLSLCVSLLLASSKLSVAVVPFTTVDVSPQKGALLSEHLATRLLEGGAQVSTPRDLEAVVGLDRQRQLLGCESTNCMAELAGALGVEAIAQGEVAKIDNGYRLLVKVLGASDAKPRFARSVSTNSEAELFTAIDEMADAILGKTHVAATRSLAPVVPIAIGGASLLAGAGFLIGSALQFGDLNKRGETALSYSDAVSTRANGERNQWVGVGLASGGAAVLAAGLIWLAVSPADQKTAMWIVPSRDGFAVGGVW